MQGEEDYMLSDHKQLYKEKYPSMTGVLSEAQDLINSLRRRYVISYLLMLLVPPLICVIILWAIREFPGIMKEVPGDDVFSVAMFGVILSFAIMSIMAIWRYRMINRRLLEPLYEIIMTADAINHGNRHNVIDYAAKSDLSLVAHALESLQYHLNDSLEIARTTEEQKQLFLSGIAHDLRAPLTSILWYTEALQQGIATTEEKKKQYLDAISFQASVLTHLVNELLIYNKLSNRQVQFPMKRMDLSQTMATFLEKGKQALAEKRVYITSRLEPHVYINGNEEELVRVISNFVNNSVKYRNKPETNAHITVYRMGHTAYLTYQDDGPGVDDSMLDHIFEPFFRTPEGSKKTANGSGLGLAVVSEIVSIHKGHVKAYNNQGLLIKISIPTAEEERHG
jgi:signal transduction histidine kinase